MSDPAVEAARRAMDQMSTIDIYEHDLERAAREALKPIREIHKPVLPPGIERCGECDVAWPCDTARLIYTTEELS